MIVLIHRPWRCVYMHTHVLSESPDALRPPGQIDSPIRHTLRCDICYTSTLDALYTCICASLLWGTQAQRWPHKQRGGYRGHCCLTVTWVLRATALISSKWQSSQNRPMFLWCTHTHFRGCVVFGNWQNETATFSMDIFSQLQKNAWAPQCLAPK